VKDLFVESIPCGRRSEHRVEAVVESGFQVVVGEALFAQPRLVDARPWRPTGVHDALAQ
jgi:hypothetical protein